jgi:hypothetical protein
MYPAGIGRTGSPRLRIENRGGSTGLGNEIPVSIKCPQTLEELLNKRFFKDSVRCSQSFEIDAKCTVF